MDFESVWVDFSDEGLQVLLGKGAIDLAITAGLSLTVLRGGGSSLTTETGLASESFPVVPELPLRLSREQKALGVPLSKSRFLQGGFGWLGPATATWVYSEH